MRSDLRTARFPLHDLESRLGWPLAADLAHNVNASLAAVRKWKIRGLSWWQADELACRFDWHPVEVWGVDWLDPLVPAGHPRADPPQRIRLTIHGTICSQRR